MELRLITNINPHPKTHGSKLNKRSTNARLRFPCKLQTAARRDIIVYISIITWVAFLVLFPAKRVCSAAKEKAGNTDSGDSWPGNEIIETKEELSWLTCAH